MPINHRATATTLPKRCRNAGPKAEREVLGLPNHFAYATFEDE